MSTISLNGIPCTGGRAHRPSWGIYFADVELDREETFAKDSPCELVFADVKFTATILEGGPDKAGRSSYRIVGGRGGWAKPIGAKGYANDAGVKASNVIGDAAQSVGETVEGFPSSSLGPAWERAAGPASDVLISITPRAWYVAEDGVTRYGKRATREISAAIARGKVDLAAGFVELLSDELVDLAPGALVDGIEAVDVIHVLEGNKLRTTIWGAAGSGDRRLQAWQALFDKLDPFRKFRTIYEYRVVNQEGGKRLNLQPVRVALGMPELRRVPVRPGVAGCRADVTLGSFVLVAFVNADPSRPVVIGFADEESPGFAPARLDLVGKDDEGVTTGTEIGRVVRYGDPIVFASPGPGVLSAGTIPPVGVGLSRVRA